MDELLSLTDVCQRYRISKWTVYQWTSKRLIPHLKLRGAIRFREQDLKKWEESNLSGAIKANLV
jgi:excisionase family DNA binding protein